MERKKVFGPYLFGILVGFLMVSIFILGTRLLVIHQSFLGNLLMNGALAIWPIYIFSILLYTHFLKNTSQKTHLIKPLMVSLLLPPIGALLGVVLINLLLSILGV